MACRVFASSAAHLHLAAQPCCRRGRPCASRLFSSDVWHAYGLQQPSGRSSGRGTQLRAPHRRTHASVATASRPTARITLWRMTPTLTLYGVAARRSSGERNVRHPCVEPNSLSRFELRRLGHERCHLLALGADFITLADAPSTKAASSGQNSPEFEVSLQEWDARAALKNAKRLLRRGRSSYNLPML